MCNRALDEWHCNAHANNLVVIDPSTCASDDDSLRFLSFLDLDMAFRRDTFVNFATGKVSVLFGSLLLLLFVLLTP